MKELIDKWINATCEYFDIDRATLLGRKRRKHINEARSVAMWLLYYKAELTYKHIGEIFSNRSHSTVILCTHSIDMAHVNAVKDLVETKRQAEMALDVE